MMGELPPEGGGVGRIVDSEVGMGFGRDVGSIQP